ncbi:nucleotidyltransferase family protein [Streptomyces sp. TE33382]
MDIAPTQGEVTSEELVEALVAHRLTGRFLARWADSAQPEGYFEVVGSLAEIDARIAARAQAHTAHVLRLQSLGDQDRPTLLIKGFTPHYNTRGRAPHHGSSDIDLLPRDPVEFMSLARSLGYQDFERYVGFHEVGYLVLGDAEDRESQVMLDIHRGFPVFAFPHSQDGGHRVEGRIDIDPMGSDPSAIRSLISYEDLAEQWHWVDVPHGRIAMLRPEAATLVTCAHIYKNCTNRAWRYPMANLPLGELADALDMAREDEFDAQRFRDLVERFHATDAVAFVAHAAEHLIGNVPAGLKRYSGYPLWNSRVLWADFDHPLAVSWPTPLEDFENLVVRNQEPSEYVRNLGATNVHAMASGESSPCYALGSEGIGVITHRRNLHAIHATLQITWDDDILVFRITPQSSPDGETRVFFNFGVPVYEVVVPSEGKPVVLDSTQGRRAEGGPQCEIVSAEEKGTRMLVAQFPLRLLGGAVTAGLPRECHALVGVRQAVPGSERNATVVSPLRIISTGRPGLVEGVK